MSELKIANSRFNHRLKPLIRAVEQDNSRSMEWHSKRIYAPQVLVVTSL